MATLADLAGKALHDDFASVKYGTIARDAIRTAIGMIYRTTELARGDYVPAPITLPVGALGVTIPDAGLHLTSVQHVDTGAELEPLSVDDVAVAQNTAAGRRGRPSGYALTGAGLTAEGLTLVVTPIPDRAYTLQLVGSFAPDATALDQDVDVVPLPGDYLDLPVSYARSELFAFEGDSAMADFHLTRFNGRLAQLRGDLAVRLKRSRRVPGTWSGVASGPQFHRPGLL